MTIRLDGHDEVIFWDEVVVAALPMLHDSIWTSEVAGYDVQSKISLQGTLADAVAAFADALLLARRERLKASNREDDDE